MFLPELNEAGHGNIKLVVTIVVVHAINLSGGRQTMGLLEIPDCRLGVHIEHVRQGRKASKFRVEEKTTFLEEYGNGHFSIPEVTEDGADFCGAGVRNGDDLNQTSGIDRFGFGRGEERIDVDIPLCHQPQQRLHRYDGA